jgi:hypothetical protein
VNLHEQKILAEIVPALSKLSRAFAILFGIVAAFWLILPWWQVFAGLADGIMPFFVCTIVAIFFGFVGVVLHFCHRYTRSGEHSLFTQILLWSFVSLAGLAGLAMAFRIVWTFFVPFVP